MGYYQTERTKAKRETHQQDKGRQGEQHQTETGQRHLSRLLHVVMDDTPDYLPTIPHTMLSFALLVSHLLA